MKKQIILLALMLISMTSHSQTLNIEVSNVVYQFPASQAGEMVYTDGTTLTVMGRSISLSDISRAYVDFSTVTDNVVNVKYSDDSATKVYIAGNVAEYVSASVSGGHVIVTQDSNVSDDTCGEITYNLSGTSSDGEFYMTGSFKSSIELNGLTLTNPEGAAINIQNGKRISVSIKQNTENTLKDGSSNTTKGCFVSKGHTELKGHGILNVYSYTGCGIWSKEYIEMKNCTINVLHSVGDGVNCNQYFTMESGSLTLKDIGDDGIQVSYEDDGTDAEDTGCFTMVDGVIDMTISGNACKGIKTDKDIIIKGGSLTIVQSGGLTTTSTDISYSTSLKSGGDINISGGTINITNTADGGKGLSSDGNITIDESTGIPNVTIKANGKGGTVELSDSGDDTSSQSYVVYISLPTGGGGFGGGGSQAWKNPVLYNSNGTKIASLTQTVTKTSGYSSATFYYYDFKDADTSVSYYIQGDNYTSRGTTYTIKSASFNAPTSGSDIYYSISNSYTTSGTTRTYSLSNVTNTYSGSIDTTEESGEGYNAAGMKADGTITISGGSIEISNSGVMSKSIKSKSSVTISGGSLKLTPSGAMLLNGNDASYSTGVKCVEFSQSGGDLTITSSGQAGRGISCTSMSVSGGIMTITNSGAGLEGTNDNYTSKCIKADSNIELLSGTITLKATGTGGKCIKCNGNFIQGVSGGSGPTLSITTTGSGLGSSSSGGFPGGGGGWGQTNTGSSSKGVKVEGTITIYGGESTYSTATDGAEGLESKTSSATAIVIKGGHHYFKCYDDCINTAGCIVFDGGITICWSTGNDAIDSNYGSSGAITIGNGAVMSYTSKGAPEEGFDCDNNSYIKISGTGIGLSAGAAQGGGGGSSSSISNAAQGYYLNTSTMSYNSAYYYTLADSKGNNLVTYHFPTSISSSLSLITATGMVKGSKYYLTYSSSAPTDASDSFQGLYIGSSATGTTEAKYFKDGSTSVNYFTAQ